MLYVILGIVMVFWAWMQAAMGQLQKHKKDARAQWVRVDALLQSRSRLILELLELADGKGLEAQDLMAAIYEMDGGWCRSDDREVISACAENVTPLVDELRLLAQGYPALADDPDFRELEDSLKELEEEIEIQSDRYNHSIDLYNAHREKPGLRLQIAILGAIPLKGIHLRPKNS
jgi:LemA protein